MTSPKPVDVAAILSAVYRPPSDQLDQMAERVRARLALIDTLSECVHLLVDAPASAIGSTLGTTESSNTGGEGDARATGQ